MGPEEQETLSFIMQPATRRQRLAANNYTYRMRAAVVAILCLALAACGTTPGKPPAQAPPAARNLVIITIDTLRADHVGAYGDKRARTPDLDRLARDGVRFEHAYATAPITLTSHASLMTGRYPPGHGARHNGMRVDLEDADAGRRVGAGRLRDGGVHRGISARSPIRPDQGISDLRRPDAAAAGRAARQRTPGPRGRGRGARVARRAPRTSDSSSGCISSSRTRRTAIPPTASGLRRSAYDEEIAEADRQAGRLIDGARADRGATTLVVAAADHGEAFGEHGEISHSMFVYDTTLRVPLIISGPGVPRADGRRRSVARRRGADGAWRCWDSGRSMRTASTFGPALAGRDAARTRELYAESFAPLLDFGWSPLRAMRAGGWKYIAAPKPELYKIAGDPGESANLRQTGSPRRSGVPRPRGPACHRATLPKQCAQRSRGRGAAAGARLRVRHGRRVEGHARRTRRIERGSRAARAGHLGRAAGPGARTGAARDPPRRSRQPAGEPAARLRAARVAAAAGGGTATSERRSPRTCRQRTRTSGSRRARLRQRQFAAATPRCETPNASSPDNPVVSRKPRPRALGQRSSRGRDRPPAAGADARSRSPSGAVLRSPSPSLAPAAAPRPQRRRRSASSPATRRAAAQRSRTTARATQRPSREPCASNPDATALSPATGCAATNVSDGHIQIGLSG